MKTTLTYLILPLFALFGLSSAISEAQFPKKETQTGTLETLIVESGTVAMDLDLNRLNGIRSGTQSKPEALRFQTAPDSFFPILVFNNELRGPTLGSIALVPGDSVVPPAPLSSSFKQLVVEKVDASLPFDLVVRDATTGFIFFNIEGVHYRYDAATRSLQIKGDRLLISQDFAKTLGRPAEAGAVTGSISIATTMRPIEVRKVVNGVDESVVMPPAGSSGAAAPAFVPGPDVIVGDMPSMEQSGTSGSQRGLAIGTTSCNAGDVELNWFQLPNTDHPVIPQNFYRMSGGTSNTDRFEQVGQSWLKHAFTALQNNACNFGCTPSGTGSRLGVGCSDPYSAGLNGSQGGLGSRAWVNPFTGSFPSTASNHSGHSHSGTTHRVLVEANDLNTTMNTGATYYAESQYVTPHEYAWCQAHPGQCNMYNNVSYRRFNVTGTTNFNFTPVGATVRTQPAVNAWTGATRNPIQPEPGVDGQGTVAYKVSGPVGGVWHYEYAVYNENLDRSIQSFSVPLGCGVTPGNIGFHAPLNHPGIANDGTVGSAGYSNTPWTPNQTASSLTWTTETLAQNPNANAIRWGTMYNFRFDSNRPPQAASATVGFFKTGQPITVAIQAPTPDACAPLQATTAVSRKMHGTAGTFDINLPLTGEPGIECRSGGVGNDYVFVFTFTNSVVSGNATVTTGVGSVSGSPVFSGNTMTVNLTGITDVQRITVTLSNVTDTFSQVLPDTPVSANMLIGDTNGNRSVTASDLGQTKANSGATASPTTFRTDVNASGQTNASDVGRVKTVVGNNLPPSG